MKIWFVGTSLPDGRWMPEGAFLSEGEACEAANENEFVLLATIGERFPIEATDAEKVYWPKRERWEESTLYNIRHNA